jgi:hypothetical protein
MLALDLHQVMDDQAARAQDQGEAADQPDPGVDRLQQAARYRVRDEELHHHHDSHHEADSKR